MAGSGSIWIGCVCSKKAFITPSKLLLYTLSFKKIIMAAPYKRGYHHTKSKGHESNVDCNFCGRSVPRWKTFATFRGFRITDPVLRQAIDKRAVSMFQRKQYACPSCARHRGIVKAGRSRKSRRGPQSI
jgi:small subunit ribosomal protein S26e